MRQAATPEPATHTHTHTIDDNGIRTGFSEFQDKDFISGQGLMDFRTRISGQGFQDRRLTPTFLRRSPTMLRAEIRVEGV